MIHGLLRRSGVFFGKKGPRFPAKSSLSPAGGLPDADPLAGVGQSDLRLSGGVYPGGSVRGEARKRCYALTILYKLPLDSGPVPRYTFTHQTVEAEIKPVMPPQRTRGAENRVGNKPANGPPRARAKAFTAEYPATCGHTSVAGGMLVLR